MKKFTVLSFTIIFLISLGLMAKHAQFSIAIYCIAQVLWIINTYAQVEGFLDDESERYDMLGYIPSVISILSLVVTLVAIVKAQLGSQKNLPATFVGITTIVETVLCLFAIFFIRKFLIEKGLAKKV